MIDHVLVATDGSDTAIKAVDAAAGTVTYVDEDGEEVTITVDKPSE